MATISRAKRAIKLKHKSGVTCLVRLDFLRLGFMSSNHLPVVLESKGSVACRPEFHRGLRHGQWQFDRGLVERASG